jgi:hypothetical protein
MPRHCAQTTLRAIVVALVLAPAAVAGAEGQTPAAPPEVRAQAAAPGAAPDVDVSLARIRRQLRETPPTRDPAQTSLLKLEYYVQVVGSPPPLDFFKEFNIGRASSVQYGGMTHAEFLRITQPFWRKW